MASACTRRGMRVDILKTSRTGLRNLPAPPRNMGVIGFVRLFRVFGKIAKYYENCGCVCSWYKGRRLTII